MARWKLIFQCEACGACVGRDLYHPDPQLVRDEYEPSGYVEVCPRCAHMQGRVVKTARMESAGVWYKPWTWMCTRWVGIKEFKTE